MKASYFDGKRQLRITYDSGRQAIKRNDVGAINNLVSTLDNLQKALEEQFDLDRFGKYVLNKEIKQMRIWLLSSINKKRLANEQKSIRDTEQRS